ncbi:MAG: peptide deformylase [Candidatus Pacebacteria bacterium]|jgi:peptide deformylase|nr:peptide deformylase [Candidatus Paceibacterota bacterium]MBT4652762.1 peptide deformylase [Candidatus Paceibacterota bacterium]MBT6755919.1 peptide deformylase [Candidatus Paceibacterota bacterium]MBT6921132.1 peptide deformylase [Candidatus Paceibacterota bacterium]
MKIINIPHPTLREKAKRVEKATPEFISFLNEMKNSLTNTANPQGVGLAAPQVNALHRVFLTLVDEKVNGKAREAALGYEKRMNPQEFINPIITKHDTKHTFGPDPDNPRLEGCLSMPGLYGPIPRWEWIEVEYQAFHDGILVEKKGRFDGFHARVIQHEIDHLDGILFTDYSLQYDLPVYVEKKQKLVEITDRSALELF